MHNTSQKHNIDLMKDKLLCLRSGSPLEHMMEKFRQFSVLCENPKFQALVDILNGSSQGFFASDSYFQENYPKEVAMYYGLVWLNGITISNMRLIKYAELCQCIEYTFANTQSNLKSLSEIAALFLGCCDQGVPTLSAALQVDRDIFEALFNLAMKNEDPNIMNKAIDTILK